MQEQYFPLNAVLEKARSQLPVGALIHGEAFSLFEAMSAVEIGNEKMDSGMLATPKTLGQLIAEGAAPLELSPGQQLAVLDKLLALEGTWHRGGSLAQTVYTCLYMLDMARLTGPENLVLSAFCQALKSTCVSIRVLIMNGGVVEEEDFNPNVFGLPLDDSIVLSSAQDGGEAEAKLEEAIQYCLEQKKVAPGQEAEFEALVTRLRFRSEFIKGLHSLVRDNLSEKDLGSTSSQFNKAATLVKDMGSQAKALSATSASSDSATSYSSEPPGFNETVNRNMLAPAPPRMVKRLAGEDVWAHYTSLLQHLILACSLTSIKDYAAMKRWTIHFASLRPGPVARSASHFLLQAKTWGGIMPGDPVPADATDAAVVLPSWVVQRDMICNAVLLPTASEAFPEGGLGQDLEMFLEQSVIAVGNWVQAMMMNASRQRRRLRRGLEDWGNLYQHALNADTSQEFAELGVKIGWTWPNIENDPQGPLGTWVEMETASIMLSHLLLGFELDIYLPKEYAMLYWYCASLFNSSRNAIEMLLMAMPPEASAKPAAAQPKGVKPLSARGGKGKGPSSSKAIGGDSRLLQEAIVEARRVQYTFDIVQAEAHQHMCQGVLRLLLGLKLAGTVSEPKLPFNDVCQCFDQRFASFHTHIMRPEPLGFDTFVQSCDVSKHTHDMLLRLAIDSFIMVRKAVQVMLTAPKFQAILNADLAAELKLLERTAVQNSLACSVISQSVQRQKQGQEQAKLPSGKEAKPVAFEGSTNATGSAVGGSGKMDFTVKYDFSQSKSFPTIGVKSGSK